MELNVNTRAWEKANQLVKQWLIPAVVYGKHLKAPMSVSCIKNDFLKRYKEAGYSTPIILKGKDIDQMALIQDIQVDPVTDNLIHIDFLAVKQDEKVRTEVPIVMIGESSVEKLGEGKIQLIKDFVEVEAFPQDLPHNFTVDISVIKSMNDTIFVKDIKVSDKVTVLDDLEQAVVTVLKLAEEEIEEVPVAEAVTAEGAEWAPAWEAGKEGEPAKPGDAKAGDAKAADHGPAQSGKKPEWKDKK